MEEELQGGTQPQEEPVNDFDIIEYLEGLTGFVFDKTVLIRVARERGVKTVTRFEDLSQEQKDLCKADLLCTAYCSPEVWASQTAAHGSFSKTTGSQKLQRKEKILKMALALYEKYDAVPEEISEEGNMQWLDM